MVVNTVKALVDAAKHRDVSHQRKDEPKYLRYTPNFEK
jgi:hypothetical protein